jgi:endonuclease/exonuclease/phosphatase family metal-dependent hydrolase
MTFNVRDDSDEDGAHSWQHRRADALDLVRAHDPDLISLQEPTVSQWNDICDALPGYAPFGVFDDGSNDVEPHGGLFRAQRFEYRTDGVFWLSRTPSVPHSVSWDLDWEPRACGWTRVRDRATNRELVFASTHFDTNANGWMPSAETLHRELDGIAGSTPTILAGDFNCAAGSEAHTYLLTEGGFRDAWYETAHSDAGVLTFHGFTGRRHLPGDPAGRDQWLRTIAGGVEQFAHYSPHVVAHQNYRIDWILVRGELTCVDARIDYSSKSGALPSDHYPVVALLDWE